MKKEFWRVSINYPIHADWRSVQTRIEEIAGRPSDASGAGPFSLSGIQPRRYLDWFVKSGSEAQDLSDEFLELHISDATISFYKKDVHPSEYGHGRVQARA